jgi:hypothetical protein
MRPPRKLICKEACKRRGVPSEASRVSLIERKSASVMPFPTCLLLPACSDIRLMQDLSRPFG